MKPGPGVSAGLLEGRAGSWSLVAGPRAPAAGVGLLGGWGEQPVPDPVAYEVQAVPKLVWPAGGESESDLAGGQVGSAGCGFTTSGVCPRAG